MRERDLFIEVLELENRSERTALLARACRDDAALRGRVEQLLADHDRQESFILDTPPADLQLTVDHPSIERAGTCIGPYKLLQQIGEGGMGIVFMAEQSEPIQRTVALKIIKPGMDTRQVIARFEAERQALAMMDHPNIARVLDAGTTASEKGDGSLLPERPDGSFAQKTPVPFFGGRPYFVMELVKGVPITKYCDEKQLSLRERLELFIEVCQAVQHAHQKGIIHRDIKPTNVLVAEYDNQPVPKVIDFGVAKATAQRLTERTMYTEFGQLLGTMEYMSPEQAKLNQLDIDTRSDIYSLGVLLYELLTGSTPFEGKRLHEAAFDEMLRIIREEEPPKPSTRLSNTDRLSGVGGIRGSEPRTLSRLVKGELDWVVMKALEKDRNRRYETASALAADLARYLADEPVQACPPTAMYRLRKFARRNKAAVITAMFVSSAVLLTIAGLSASTFLIAREQRTTKNALQAETRAKADLQDTLERERHDSYFHRITLAHRELSADNLGRALQLLDECPKDLRGWEWNYLKRLCRVEPFIIQNKSEVNSVVFSPDGQRLATASGDGLVKIWDSWTGHVIQTLKAHEGFVCSVAFHPDGKHLASVGADKQVKVWDLATGQQLFAEACDTVHVYGAAYAVAFSPDGARIAAGSNGSVNVWHWSDRKLLHSFAGHEKRQICVAFSHDGRQVASGSWRGLVRLWNAESGGPPICTFAQTQNSRHPVCALAFSSDDRRLATASYNRRVDVWNTTSGELMKSLVHSGLVLCVAISPDGQRIASAGEDKIVRIWDANTGQEVLGLRGHTSHCGSVAFSPDGRRLASASMDGTIHIWDATPLEGHEGQETFTFQQQGNEVWSLAVSPDGQRIVSGGFSTPAKVWDVQTGRVNAEFSGHRDVVFCLFWQTDGQRIASAGGDGGLFTVKVWEAESGRLVCTLPPGPEYFGVAFSPDERHLVTGRANGAVEVWNAQTGDKVNTLGIHEQVVRGVVFSRDGRQLASASADGMVKLWDATQLVKGQDARAILRGRVPGPYLNVAFSPDGARLATGGPDYTVKLWDTQTGRELQVLHGQHGDIYTVAFSPDAAGRWIAASGEDSVVNVWDSHDGALLRSFRGHTGLVSSLTFSADGRQLISGSRDHTVKVWDVSHLDGRTEN